MESRCTRKPPYALLDLIEAGLPAGSLATFKQATGMTVEIGAHVLNLGGRTLSTVRKVGHERPQADLCDRLFAVAPL